MILSDVTDVVYRYILVLTSITCSLLVLFAVIGFFFIPTPKNKLAKYQNYGYLVASVAALLDEITYLIPSLIVRFNEQRSLCIAFGSIQYFVENVIVFFTISVSVYILLSVNPKYRQCQCRGRKDVGKPLFLYWTISAFVYNTVMLIFMLCNNVIDVRGSRCWITNPTKMLDVGLLELLSYRLLNIASGLVAAIYAIICNRQFKMFKRDSREAFAISGPFGDEEYKEAIMALNTLNKSLINNYIALVVTNICNALISIVIDILERRYGNDEEVMTYLGWTDIICMLIFFIYAYLFNHTFVKEFISVVSQKIGGGCKKDTINM